MIILRRFQLFLLTLLCCLVCSSCENNWTKAYPGYIEGEYTYIASGVAGTLFELYAKRGYLVKKGDLLYKLDPEPERANVETIKANITELQSQLALAKVQLARQQNLYSQGATPKSALDQAQTDFDSKSSQLTASRSQLVQTEWALQQKIVYAPIAARVFDTFYRIGEKVAVNQPVLALLSPLNIKVLFYIPEMQLSQIHVGQIVSFTCDKCKTKTQATISYISPEAEYTPPVIYSKDTRYKLVYLVRAEMPEDIAKQFHPGQPIDVFLHE